MPSRPMFAPQSKHGGTPKDCPKIQWKLFSRADISSASPRNAPYGTRRVFPVMPSSSATGPCLAFDFGAESGRAVLAHLHSGVITTEVIHRFPNHPVQYGRPLHSEVAPASIDGR